MKKLISKIKVWVGKVVIRSMEIRSDEVANMWAYTSGEELEYWRKEWEKISMKIWGMIDWMYD